MMENWTFTKTDQEILEKIQDFIPEKVFDAHAHLWQLKDCSLPEKGGIAEGPKKVTIEIWQEFMGRLIGKPRLKGGLFIGFPMCDINKTNNFLINQLKNKTFCRGEILVSPDYPQEKLLEYVKLPFISGLKPYHRFSSEKPTFESSITGYAPEWIWELADRYSLVITLHIVKHKALADPENQQEIRELLEKYPNAKLILAHAARGFHSPNTISGISSLRGLENVFFDLAAVTESASIIAILEEFGPKTILWGSDFGVSEIRGKAVTVGDGFAWLSKETVNWEKLSPACNPTLVGIESLRAINEAAEIFALNSEDIKDIFYNNSVQLLGLEKKEENITRDLYKKAKQIIPGGVGLLSKRPELYAPNQWPAYHREARGCEVWDLDGNHYYDMSSNGIGTCLLGYSDRDVERVVKRRINLGCMSTLNPAEEVELAELLLDIHPWAGQVRFARTGGESMSMAARIIRATTDRSVIAICGYHGWYDWYLAANLGEEDTLRGHLLPGLEPLGVPRELRETTVTFHFNNRKEFKQVIERYGDKLAGVIMEPCRYHDPDPGFLEYMRDEVHRVGGLLVFDEITIGWRLHFGGAHMKFGVYPDIAVFAKALGNGHPMAAVIGTSEAMEGAHRSFISSTYWTEAVGPAAALATIKKMSKSNVPSHVEKIGLQVKKYWEEYGNEYNLPVKIDKSYPCLAHFNFEGSLSNELRTLYTQLMLKEGFLAAIMIYPTLAHTEEIVGKYGEAIDRVFYEISEALKKEEVTERLKGPVAHTGFARLT
ncbi:MAG: aminotransferase class III-fold pyridoxal phosphate-dependent enzyme [Bacteroidales bacterium]|nr:aminotransferase class III-fold pyridoxal phosphate-dependent enzyme [Bacteroidales bacterium]